MSDQSATEPRPRDFLARVLVRAGLSGRSLVIAAPTLWLGLFFLVPFAVVCKIALSTSAIARPPYLPIFKWMTNGTLQIRLDFSNFLFLTQDSLYASAYISSIEIAFFSTVLCLLIGYPMAYAIARAPDRRRNVLLMLVILPFWTSFLLRVYAWIGILKANGVINNFLMSVGLIHEPLAILHTGISVYLGIVYGYRPFMILPLYANLVKLDQNLLEASADLGAKPLTTFLTITLPLSMPGIIAGSMLVLIPAVGEFVIPSLLGGPDTLMIGRVLWDEFFSNRDWPMASSVAIAMLVFVVGPIIVLRSVQSVFVERGR